MSGVRGRQTGNAAALVACKQGFKAPQARADVAAGGPRSLKGQGGFGKWPCWRTLSAFPEC